jgi:hypothetical protein
MLFEAELGERIKFIGNYRSTLKFLESVMGTMRDC